MTAPGSPASIRRAVPADLDDVSRIIREAFSIYLSRIGKPPAPMLADHLVPIMRGDTYLALAGGVVAAVLVLEPRPAELYIDIMAVDAPWRGKGLARFLMRFAEAEAIRLGRPALTLMTNAAMIENIAMYPRLGFTETHRAVEDGYSRVFFKKLIEPAA